MSQEFPGDPDAPTMDTLADPDAFRDHETVEYLAKRETVDAEEFDAVRAALEPVDGWVVVGVENDAGAVLLMDDGSHGWTLPAAPVRDGDWVARGRRAIEGLTGATVDPVRPERVRRIDYDEDGGDGRLVVHHVVL